MRSGLLNAARVALVMLLCAITSPALTHHSTAEFDYTKNVVISGVVKEVQWTNPHSYIQVLVPADSGNEQVQWGVEIGAPGINVKMGWRKDSVKFGDKITLNVAPARDGRKFATLRFLTFEDGRRLDGVALNIKGNASFN